MTNSKLRFSALLPVYDRDFLRLSLPKCLDSIAANTIRPDEIILVVDGPVSWDIDSQVYLAKQILEIRVIKLPSNVGLTRALNAGLAKCCYEYVARVDADDFCSFDRFEKQIALMEKGFDLIGSDIQEVDEQGKELFYKKMPSDSAEIRRFALRRNPFNHMTVMFRKSCVINLGGYPDFYLKEDYALWVRMLSDESLKCANIPEPLMIASTGKDFFRRRSSIKIFLQEIKMQIYIRKYLGKPIWSCSLDVLIRLIYHITPSKVKEAVYKYFLRNKA